MRTKITMAELRDALKANQWTIEKDSAFYLKHYQDTGELKKPMVVIKSGTVVGVEKVYRRGRAALLRYTDTSGKIWWSWTHASEYEAPRQYVRKGTTRL